MTLTMLGKLIRLKRTITKLKLALELDDKYNKQINIQGTRNK